MCKRGREGDRERWMDGERERGRDVWREKGREGESEREIVSESKVLLSIRRICSLKVQVLQCSHLHKGPKNKQ